MSPRTIRQIHAILSGAFAAAVRWEWIDRNPAGSAKLPKTRRRSPTSPTPSDVAAVIAAAKGQELELLALYMWLAAVTGARRGAGLSEDLQCRAQAGVVLVEEPVGGRAITHRETSVWSGTPASAA